MIDLFQYNFQGCYFGIFLSHSISMHRKNPSKVLKVEEKKTVWGESDWVGIMQSLKCNIPASYFHILFFSCNIQMNIFSLLTSFRWKLWICDRHTNRIRKHIMLKLLFFPRKKKVKNNFLCGAFLNNPPVFRTHEAGWRSSNNGWMVKDDAIRE